MAALIQSCARLASLCAALLMAVSAAAQDGTLVARDTVHFSPDFRQRLAGSLSQLGLDADELLRSVVVQRITYLSDGLRVRGYLVEPVAGDRFPVVIYNRGGSRDFSALNDTVVVLRMATLARHGYVVVGSQYRGNAGSEGREDWGGKDVDDALNLIPLLARHPRADTSRIGMWGHSRGGIVTYLALTRTDRIRAAVAEAATTDLFALLARRPMERTLAEVIPDWNTDREAAMAARSAVRWPERLHKATPVLILHGTADWRVDTDDALSMARALYQARHPFRMLLFEGADHALAEHRVEANRAIREWFDRYVRDRAPLPNLEPHGR